MSRSVYVEKMTEVLRQLRITTPEHMSANPSQVKRLIVAIEEALNTYDPLPTGNAEVGDVQAGKTFSNATGLGLVGTCAKNTVMTNVALSMATPTIAAPFVTKMLSGSVHTLLFLTHGGVLVPFAIASKKADNSEIYLVGSGCTALGVHTAFTMVITIAAGVGTIASIKTAADVEDIENWAADAGTLYCYA